MKKNSGTTILNKKSLILSFLLLVIALASILLSRKLKVETPYLPSDADIHTEEIISDDGHDLSPAFDLTENQIIAFGYQIPSLDINVSVYSLENSFVAVYRKGSQSDELMGVSELIVKETKTETIIATGDSLEYNDEVLISLYTDNGDGVFDQNTDQPAPNSNQERVEETLFIYPLDH